MFKCNPIQPHHGPGHPHQRKPLGLRRLHHHGCHHWPYPPVVESGWEHQHNEEKKKQHKVSSDVIKASFIQHGSRATMTTGQRHYYDTTGQLHQSQVQIQQVNSIRCRISTIEQQHQMQEQLRTTPRWPLGRPPRGHNWQRHQFSFRLFWLIFHHLITSASSM